MLKLPILFSILFFGSISVGTADSRLTESELASIGKRVWQNECAGTIEGLTSWNSGENFASLGIGHFIWYPRGVSGPFEESFPELVSFLEERGVTLPDWLNSRTDCPWPNRETFMAKLQSARMQRLRALLARTVSHQAAFLARRSAEALPKMLRVAAPSDRANVEKQYRRLASTAQGTFALIDYVNFKGEGVLESERYKGDGWGLLQVLAGMDGSGTGAPAEFAASARRVLARRVRNSPPERRELRWLPGWLNRVASYGSQ
jgi:hypothetical protein